jgi:glycosyltransferase involved in cell wall biosynthesis
MQNKNLELHIVGKGWDASVLETQNNLDNVFFEGYVENLEDILTNSIAIVPIRIGSGMRMKIIDAINYRIPFITTSTGVEGLDFKNGKDCMIADNYDDFADAILKLAEDKRLQQQFIQESYATQSKLYNKELLINKRRLIYRQSILDTK